MPGIDRGLEPLRKWQIESGWMAAFLNWFFFCGVVPGVFFSVDQVDSTADADCDGVCAGRMGWRVRNHLRQVAMDVRG